MLVTATSVLPVARTRGTGGNACPTALRRALYAAATPRGAEHVAVVRRDERGDGTGSGIALLGRVQRHALATWSTSSRPTTFPRGESSAPSAPV